MENATVERIRVVSETEIFVNLDAPPKLPFGNAIIEENIGGGWVKVEKCEDVLYVDGRKVILYLSEQQKNGRMSGHELREELLGKPVLHPNILDALLEYPDLIPEDWKNKNVRYFFFWGIIFRNSDGDVCVRCLFFYGGSWNCHYGWLVRGWADGFPAALLAPCTPH